MLHVLGRNAIEEMSTIVVCFMGWLKASRWLQRLACLAARICMTVISKDPAQDRNAQGERGEEPFPRQKSRDKG